jgi:cell division protein FtsL
MSARVGLILLFVSVVAMLAHVWGLTRLVEMTQQRARLSARVDSLESANSHLRAEVGQLASADRVERLAKSRLGLDFKSTEIRAVQVLVPAEER